MSFDPEIDSLTRLMNVVSVQPEEEISDEQVALAAHNIAMQGMVLHHKAPQNQGGMNVDARQIRFW